MINASPVRANDDTPGVPSPETPATEMANAIGNLTTATSTWTSTAVPGDFQWLLGSQTQYLENDLDLLTRYESIQAPFVLSHDDSSAALGNLLFLIGDQQLSQASADLLTTVQAFDTDPSSTAAFNVLAADFEFTDAAFMTSGVNDAVELLTNLSGFSPDLSI